MSRRVALTVLYAIAFGVVLAFDDLPSAGVVLLVGLWLAAPVVGFVVGRWWVVLAVVGPIVGRSIGWDPAEHDGASPFDSIFVIFYTLYIGLPLLFGVVCSYVWRAWRGPGLDYEG